LAKPQHFPAFLHQHHSHRRVNCKVARQDAEAISSSLAPPCGRDKIAFMQEPPATSPPSVLIPAATLVVFRHGAKGAPELLMVQRSEALRFAGGAAVFPGGKVDAQDRELSARLTPEHDPEIAAARIAAIRETLEETGLAIGLRRPVSASQAAAARSRLIAGDALASVLHAFGWELAPTRLVHFAHWCAPRQRAYDTHFFLSDIGSGAVELAVDETECTRLFWTTAAGALAMADAGEIRIIYPTRRNLERLALFGSFDAAVAHAAEYPVQRIIARETERNGMTWIEIPDGMGYPVVRQAITHAERG
jgi:8-oxo-dGTP pyrophosphatase MutT (NUDIX family)